MQQQQQVSNLNPVARVVTYQTMIAGESLELHKMARLTRNRKDWKGEACQRHEEEMIAFPREVCKIGLSE